MTEQDTDRQETGILVDSDLVGEVWTTAQPGTDPVLYGHVEIAPKGKFPARSLQTFRLTYTVGRFGLDDTGAIQVMLRAMGDSGTLQTTNPTGDNYVTATSSSGVPLLVNYAGRGAARPRWKCLTIRVAGGFLREGDRIKIVLGDTSHGSPGLRMQSMVEPRFEFKVAADVCAVGQYTPIPNTPNIAIVPGEAALWRAVLPSLRRPGERFHFGLKAEDKWGNPTHKAEGKFTLESTLAVDGLPATVDYALGERAMLFEGLSVAEPGTLRITVRDETGEVVARSHPLVVEDGPHGGYWADLHGQSGESIGIGTSRDYFDFGRKYAFLDALSHQANDFQVNNAFWAYLNQLTAEYHEDGRFVTFPGYEWSGNTAVGGDRNVYYRTEGRPIYRSSHALLTDRSDLDMDANDANALFERLADEDCVVYAHVGGRYADIAYAHDGTKEMSMEIHSAWGTFEWLLTDGFPLGHRCGVVCNSDGHKGRPGASYPGVSTFGAYGGLTCFLTEELTRDSFFDCLRRRHHYGTTGTRMHLDVKARFAGAATLFDQDPNLFPDTTSREVGEVMMGDIVRTTGDTITLTVRAVTQAPIERIEVRNGAEVIQTLRGYGADDLGNRIRVLWSGAEYRGRGRDTNWKGKVSFGGANIRRFEKINAWNHERLFEQQSDDTIIFDAITTGNFGGFDAWLDADQNGEMSIATNLAAMNIALADIGMEDQVVEAGGLERRIKAFRLPDDNDCREITAEIEIPITAGRDNPLWICVNTEDGFQAWSSPIYVFK
ncbi:MAG: DUF3604 domain-containing protein [Rhodospirillaceae bacterium]|nr:DUF3604 domain-containing protein [Rhodospirillaceae bacterium]MBT3495445.1 DUF3604 domain-containing protein [Rhodospirillaceae bacterium]MBT3780125.1 DUF3604 domain-containing protein [Rhodospirillaceae bacterium]MBT3975512.1 DUF3604 domain-containing protein [Rhodospirillaceae bacterium]MBT4167266.1 DUF3604 domain-containing protein [Rhodospirillaceae bacterium]